MQLLSSFLTADIGLALEDDSFDVIEPGLTFHVEAVRVVMDNIEDLQVVLADIYTDEDYEIEASGRVYTKSGRLGKGIRYIGVTFPDLPEPVRIKVLAEVASLIGQASSAAALTEEN